MKRYDLRRPLGMTLAAVMLLGAVGCGAKPSEPAQSVEAPPVDLVAELGLTDEVKDATAATAAVNSAVYSLLDFSDTREGDFAARGLIAAPEMLELRNDAGKVVWSQKAYAFLADYDAAPASVNPSLWENTKNNHYYGLFEVTEGIYQVRGYDMANLTLIKGETGWIIFDPLMSVECTQAAMDLVEEHLGAYPVKAVLISHPHVDHYGGIRGVMAPEEAADKTLSIDAQLDSGKIPIIVPQHFTQHAVSENIYAGTAMERRAAYQYGSFLPDSVTGGMAMGIGMGQSIGTISFITPTYEIRATGETLTIDGVEMEFQMTPGTEAPAEMNVWFPAHKALWMAENCTGTLHNLYTLRGAQVRDGAAWSGYICEAITRYGAEVEVTFQSHNWPHWGNDVTNEYLLNTAAIYRFINDQTLTYVNQGYTSNEIANMIRLPQGLEKNWYTRQYYGTVAHDAKAVYQKYMGWYDANPVHLHPLTPTESAAKWQAYMSLGSVEEVLRQAKRDFDNGEFQWVAEVTNTLVFADPENKAARLLCADALEQLGYQAESGTWRNVYLTGALELRGSKEDLSDKYATRSGGLMTNLTPSMLFDFFGIMLNKEAMAEEDLAMNIVLEDVGETYLLRVVSGVLLQFPGHREDAADLTVTCDLTDLLSLLQKDTTALGRMTFDGDAAVFQKLLKNLDQVDISSHVAFHIVEP